MVERLRIITVIFFIAVSLFFISVTYPTSALAEITIDSPASGATVGGIVAVDVSYSGTFDAPIYYTGIPGTHHLIRLSIVICELSDVSPEFVGIH